MNTNLHEFFTKGNTRKAQTPTCPILRICDRRKMTNGVRSQRLFESDKLSYFLSEDFFRKLNGKKSKNET